MDAHTATSQVEALLDLQVSTRDASPAEKAFGITDPQPALSKNEQERALARAQVLVGLALVAEVRELRQAVEKAAHR